jgi:hypothetical protein
MAVLMVAMIGYGLFVAALVLLVAWLLTRGR